MKYIIFMALFLSSCSGAPTQMSERDYQMACVRGCKDKKRVCQSVRPAVYRKTSSRDEQCHKKYLICYVDHCHINQMLKITNPL